MELVPFLLTIWLTAALSLAFKVTLKPVAEVISTAVLVRVRLEPPSPTMLSLLTSMSLLAPLSFRKPVPMTLSTPVLAL